MDSIDGGMLAGVVIVAVTLVKIVEKLLDFAIDNWRDKRDSSKMHLSGTARCHFDPELKQMLASMHQIQTSEDVNGVKRVFFPMQQLENRFQQLERSIEQGNQALLAELRTQTRVLHELTREHHG